MSYDAIVVGGGLAGAALADQLARAGHDVLVLERETRFKDRVRGENMLPWGVAAAKRLGIHDELVRAGGLPSPNFVKVAMGQFSPPRDMRVTTPGGDAMLNMYHPDLQETMLARAASAGAEVMRGATVLALDAGPGRPPAVAFEYKGLRQTLNSRIVIGADGRASLMRSWAGFNVQQNPELLTIAGTLLSGTEVPDASAYFCMGPGIASFWAPLGQQRSRVYFIYPGVAGRRALSGKHKIAEFLQSVQSVGVPRDWLAGAEADGPLAEFDGADRWVESPARNGVALIGDAAASSDPSWGSGLSLTLLDVEHLANALRATDDWDAALAQYARQHDEYYAALHRILSWMTELFWSAGPKADERRARVFPRMMSDPTGFPDAAGLGPFGPSDERARRLILGLE
jgi:2-polyprenyl-6-methoxyphenol hydroxylase-like FAD-dependent oxidoreductase